jgi:hypothetical protein
MPRAPARDRQPRPKSVADRVFLRCDDEGCTLSGAASERRFPDLQTAVECARHSRDTQEATIEIWRGGEYICCVTPRSWRHSAADFPSIAAPLLVPQSLLAAAERHANRAARVLMATAGPLFWLALMLVAVAASLGWRVLIL